MKRLPFALLALILVLTIGFALSQCSGETMYQAQHIAPTPIIDEPMAGTADKFATYATVAAERRAADQSIPAANIPISMPKIAYVFDYGFRINAGQIPKLQRRHADLCERQGPQVCRILEMRQTGDEGEYASGSLALAVAAPRARSFGVELGKVADEAGGSTVSSAISGEDLSKKIVDTEAHLRARSLLRDRLMEVLASRKGTVAELVEAERGVAQVNEEIDQARSWLNEMQGRVDFSRVSISYNSGSPASGGFLSPIRDALGNVSSILGMLIAALIIAVTVLVPLGLLGWGLLRLWRRVRQLNDQPETFTE